MCCGNNHNIHNAYENNRKCSEFHTHEWTIIILQRIVSDPGSKENIESDKEVSNP